MADGNFENLTVTGISDLGGQVRVGGDLSVGDASVGLASTLRVAGELSVGDASVGLASPLRVTGPIIGEGGLSITGLAELQDTRVQGALTVDPDKLTSLGALSLSGLANLQETQVHGALTVDADKQTTLGGVLEVAGAITGKGALTLSGLADLQDAQVHGAFTVDRSSSFAGTLHVSGATTLDGALSVSHLTTLNRLNVTGATDLQDSVTVHGALTVDVGKQTTLGGALTVAGAGSFAGNVGIGTIAPVARLHVVDTKAGDAAAGNNIVHIENAHPGGDNADVLSLKIDTMDPQRSNNFITFWGSRGTLGAIQGNGRGSVELAGAGNDYAESLPRLREDERIEQGDLVGLFGGRVTKATAEADHVLAISSGPIVVGNLPGEEDRHLYEQVAFVGQVRVKVRGAVRTGDYIIPSGLNDGTGIAVPPQEMMATSDAQVVGRAWESSDEERVKLINTATCLQSGYPWIGNIVAALRTLQEETKTLKTKLEKLTTL